MSNARKHKKCVELIVIIIIMTYLVYVFLFTVTLNKWSRKHLYMTCYFCSEFDSGCKNAICWPQDGTAVYMQPTDWTLYQGHLHNLIQSDTTAQQKGDIKYTYLFLHKVMYQLQTSHSAFTFGRTFKPVGNRSKGRKHIEINGSVSKSVQCFSM